MGTKERDLINIRLSSLQPNERLFRANAGMGWAGRSVKRGKHVIIENAMPFHGMPEGMPDLIGWTTVTITPDMVGQRIAVFTGVEVKATGKLSEIQDKFRSLILGMGGFHTTLK